MLNSRDINDLNLIVKTKCKAHIENCLSRGVEVILTSTIRDDEYQGMLYAQGRTKPGQIVTNMSLTGAHGIAVAYDVVPVVEGKAVWDDNRLWTVIGEEGKKLGLTWGGDWKFKDKPHFEMTFGYTWRTLKNK